MKRSATNEILFQLFIREECSQRAFCKKVNLHEKSLSDYLHNKYDIQFAKLEEIARILNKKICIKFVP
jgi:transcriptional regulator with XRE-family HTH domain